VAVAAPFAALTYFVHDVVERRITTDIAEFFLQNKASDVADKINLSLAERARDLRIWSREPTAIAALKDADDVQAHASLVQMLDRFCALKEVYDLLTVIDASGRAIAWNTRDARGEALSPQSQRRLAGVDLFDAPWFRTALEGQFARVDWHLDPLQQEDVSRRSSEPSEYSVGFAAPIRDPDSREVLGVWYSLMDWRWIQVEILDRVEEAIRQLSRNRGYRGGYAFLWKEDADTIIGHSDRALYGEKVSGDRINLPRLSAAVRRDPGRLVLYSYPEGQPKRAAFRQTIPQEKGGFGWIVGVGLQDEPIFAPARVLGAILAFGTFAILAGLLIWALIVSRTVTRPLAALAAEAERIARGDLGARVAPAGPAETVALAHAFNRMTEDLARSREQVVRAEKESAWREMARQISHEIKNPLTPMKLSISLVERARREGSPDFDAILKRSVETIDRQVESLRRIASDFRAFAGAPVRRREPVSVKSLLEQAASLYTATAADRRITIARDAGGEEVTGDPEELVRAVVNLLDNAVQAAPEGSDIRLQARSVDGVVRISVHDDGPGVPPDVRSKLFTPYFSTRTQGTGLGLAIVRRIAEDHGGRAFLDESEPGTTMVVELPLANG
jgi:signal transduction histidine kinase